MLRLTSVLLCSIIIGVCGCGGGPAFSVAPVTGKVTCQGKPVTDASITFSPITEAKSVGKAANGSLNGTGEFTLSTYGNNDGAVLGKHRVMISYEKENHKSPCSTAKEIIVEVTNNKNHFEIELDKAGQKK